MAERSAQVKVTSGIKKPMLAIKVEDVKDLVFPLLATAKLDGIRALAVKDGTRLVLVSRNFKPIPNIHIQNLFATKILSGMDGEIIIEKDGIPIDFNEISSIVMSDNKEIPSDLSVRYYLFDYVKDSLDKPYIERIKDLENLDLDTDFKKLIPTELNNQKDLDDYYQELLTEGYEGIILRSKNSPYKEGRSTFKEHFLMKLKPFEDAEAKVIELQELLKNDNESSENVFGHSHRSSCKAGMVPMNTLGAFIVEDLKTGLKFSIGTGVNLTLEKRKEIWDNKSEFIGKIIKYRFQSVGVKELPRFPSWLGFRDERDI